jgi:drug/metabolite transporter (DMT)-like permease
LSRRGWVLFALMGFIWGIPYLLIKVAVVDLSPPTLVFLRTLIGAAILLPIAARRGELRQLPRHAGPIAVYALIEVAVPWLLLSDAERRLSSSLAGLVVATVPLIGALLARIMGARDRLDCRGTLGLVVGFVGVGALVGLDISARDIGAVAEMSMVTICYAVGAMFIARRLAGAPAVGVNTAALALAALVYAPVGIALAPHTMPSLQVGLAVIGLGVICTAVAFIVFFALIAEVGPVRATVVTYVNPAVALLLGVILLREPLTLGAVLGFGLILLGSVLTNRRRPDRRGSRATDAPATVPAGPPDAAGT